MIGGDNHLGELYKMAGEVKSLVANSPGHSIRTARGKPSQPCLWFFWWIFLFVAGERGVVAQPPENLNPDDTEAIIAAFLNDAAAQQWEDEEVNRVLEHILQQDAAYQAGEASIQHQEVIPVPAPFHGPNSPISTPTQRDEEEEEKEQTDDDVVEPSRH